MLYPAELRGLSIVIQYIAGNLACCIALLVTRYAMPMLCRPSVASQLI
jgi:hypothetical protein